MAGTNDERSCNMPIFILLHSLEITVGESGDYYWAWAASVSGLVLHILAVVHAVLWGLPSAIVGSLVCMCMSNMNMLVRLFISFRQPLLEWCISQALDVDWLQVE